MTSILLIHIGLKTRLSKAQLKVCTDSQAAAHIVEVGSIKRVEKN